VMPLYISLMYQIMKDEGCHEGVIEQIYGLFNNLLLSDNPPLDEAKRLRMDGVETNDDIQGKIKAVWTKVTTENFPELGDYQGYNQDFLKLFGFEFDGVDYDQDVDPLVEW
jgi:enoyl-[acyl-carrier protein] reductase/trans-2-enoyl-CoA reductase (NAD+)